MKDTPTSLPPKLSTEAAMALWRKAQAAGYVDANYQPLISRTQAALLADYMAEQLDIKDKWKVFEELWCICGSDYAGIIGLAIDKYKAVREMIDFCDEYNIEAYSDLLKYASNERSDWFRVLCDNATIVMKEYLKSRSWKDSKVNPSP